jgi:hypothetical protein
MNEFTCAVCHGTFGKLDNNEWNEIKALAEYVELYPEAIDAPKAQICDPCNKIFDEWFMTLTDEQKREMQDEYEKELSCLK